MDGVSFEVWMYRGGGQARAIRGTVLAANPPASDELTRLQALDAQISALRAQLTH